MYLITQIVIDVWASLRGAAGLAVAQPPPSPNLGDRGKNYSRHK